MEWTGWECKSLQAERDHYPSLFFCLIFFGSYNQNYIIEVISGSSNNKPSGTKDNCPPLFWTREWGQPGDYNYSKYIRNIYNLINLNHIFLNVCTLIVWKGHLWVLKITSWFSGMVSISEVISFVWFCFLKKKSWSLQTARPLLLCCSTYCIHSVVVGC